MGAITISLSFLSECDFFARFSNNSFLVAISSASTVVVRLLVLSNVLSIPERISAIFFCSGSGGMNTSNSAKEENATDLRRLTETSSSTGRTYRREAALEWRDKASHCSWNQHVGLALKVPILFVFGQVSLASGTRAPGLSAGPGRGQRAARMLGRAKTATARLATVFYSARFPL